MARAKTVETDSPYYPPRARWYSPVLYLWDTLRRWVWLDRIHVQLPEGMTFAGSAASFLVPGLGFYLRGPKLWALAAWLGYGLLLLFFLAAYGYLAGNFAYGLLIAIHVIGFLYYCGPFWQRAEVSSRLLVALLALLAIGLLFYLPARNAVLQHWWVPLRLHSRVLVVQRQFPAAAIRRGDWIAYRLGGASLGWERGWAHGSVREDSGLGLGPVLAVTGDRVGFATNGFTVNGVLHPLLPHMPQSGEVTLREKQWFIWPEVDITVHGNTPESNVSAMMLGLASVPENEFVGKPFKRWLGRRQITP
jgi:hypothetical protein